jgi:CheY-like chemotaxis protein
MSPVKSPFVVIIDDDEDDRAMLSSALDLQDLKSVCFENAQLALVKLKSWNAIGQFPALIIADYNMPKVNGEEFLKLLKSETSINEIPVVIYSTSISPKLHEVLIDSGAYATIKKANSYREFTLQVLEIKKIVCSLQVAAQAKKPVSFEKPITRLRTFNQARQRVLFAMTVQDLCANEYREQASILVSRRHLHPIKNPISRKV